MKRAQTSSIVTACVTSLLLASAVAQAQPTDHAWSSDFTLDEEYVYHPGDYAWVIDDAAVVTGPANSIVGRLFIGASLNRGGTPGTTTFTITSNTPDNPGSLILPGNSYAAIRLGHDSHTDHIGILSIDGGVHLGVGHIFKEVQGHLNIINGTVELTSTTTGKRLTGVNVMIDANGTLILPTLDVIDAASFATWAGTSVEMTGAFRSQATLEAAPGMTLQFNQADGKTLVTAVPEPASLALIGVGSLLALRRRRP